MQAESKKILVGLAILMAVSIAFTFHRSYVARNYDLVPTSVSESAGEE